MTEHPGEQFPPDVDPDVEPGFDPYPSEEPPENPDYDTEPAPQNLSSDEPPSEPPYAADAVEPTYGSGAEHANSGGAGKSDAAAESDEAGESAGHVDPAEVEFGPEFARAPGEEHEHPFAAESAVPEHAEAEPDPAGESVAEYSAEDEADEERAHPLVEETMGRLGELRDRPVGEHAEVYADLHERLQSALVEADAEPGDRG